MILEVWYDEVYTASFPPLRAGDVVVDAGANIGLFSLWIARHYPACQILAFEPFEENYQFLLGNLASAGASAIRPFQMGLAGETGFRAMVEGGERSQDHRLAIVPPTSEGSPTVRTCSFADVLSLAGSDRIALFKCDIEGAEQELFERTESDFGRVLRFSIEYHDNIRPGTLAMLQSCLRATHDVIVQPAGTWGYGMLYATLKSA